jgi:hypothetical protein
VVAPNEDNELGFPHKRIILTLKGEETDSKRKLCIILRMCWCYIIVLNVHASIEDKIDYMKDSFCKGL